MKTNTKKKILYCSIIVMVVLSLSMAIYHLFLGNLAWFLTRLSNSLLWALVFSLMIQRDKCLDLIVVYELRESMDKVIKELEEKKRLGL